jgi:iron complex outermembrane recepter protein
LEFGYKVTAELELVLGAQNAFNKYPDENPYGGVAGAKYPTTTPYGFNGGMYYVRAVYQF